MNGYLMPKIAQPDTLVHRNGPLSVQKKRLAAADAKCYIEWWFSKGFGS
jgi:hypothetical protein